MSNSSPAEDAAPAQPFIAGLPNPLPMAEEAADVPAGSPPPFSPQSPQPQSASSPPPAPARPMIQLIDFHKRYGDFTAVEKLNMSIPAGELFGFIGPNGAGKSTTIRFLATLLQATSGEGYVNGCSVVKDPLG